MEKIQEFLTSINLDNLILLIKTSFNGEPWLQSGILFLTTFFLASLLSWIIVTILGFLTRKTTTYLDDKLLIIARPPIYYSLVITGFSTAIKVMPLSNKATTMALHGLQTIGVIVWTLALINISKIILKQLAWLSHKGRFIRPQTLPLFDNLVRVLIIAIAIYITFRIWGIDMTAWLASAGIVGIAVGFAAKDTLANLFSGVFILADTPYKIGDYVVLGDSQRGKVTHIGIRSTRFLTRDDVEITVPNSIVGNSKIINQTGGPHSKFRLRIKVGLAYGSDINYSRELLVRLAKECEGICKTPEPRIRFRHFGGSSLDHELLCWVDNPELRGRVTDRISTIIYNQFMKEGIEIPYAKQDVYIKEMPKVNNKVAPARVLDKI
ncbi:MAG: mechanosensitive ion channel family protein [Thiotrichaceae bacterium]|nr:mechanosensitive ion channel family protein [Thiotrichaceae bacterium]